MKKIMAVMAIAFVFCFISSSALASSVNVLEGVPTDDGESALTDGSFSTAVLIGGAADPHYSWTLDAPVTVVSAEVFGTDGNTLAMTDTMDLYDSSGTLLASVSPGEIVSPINNVSKIDYYYGGTNFSIDVGEIHVFQNEPDLTAPSNVSGLSATPADGQVTLNWNPSGSADLDHYEIYQDGTLVDGNVIVPPYTINGLTNGTTYVFVVKVVDTSGNVSSGVSVSSTPAVSTDTSPPPDVTNLRVTDKTASTVNLAFDLPTVSDFDHAIVYRNNVDVGHVTTGVFSDTGLTAETSYTYKITTVDDAGNESSGSILSVQTPAINDTIAPLSPTGVTSESGNSYGTVSWDANDELDIFGYNVYVDGVKANTSIITGTSFVVDGLENGLSYEVYVTAVDMSGNESNQSSFVYIYPVTAAMPNVDFDYTLQDVSNWISGWFSSLWLILAFAISIPVAFLIGRRVKGLFVG